MRKLTNNEVSVINFGLKNCKCLPSGIEIESSLLSACGSFCCVKYKSKGHVFTTPVANGYGVVVHYKLEYSCDEFRDFMRAIDFMQ